MPGRKHCNHLENGNKKIRYQVLNKAITFGLTMPKFYFVAMDEKPGKVLLDSDDDDDDVIVSSTGQVFEQNCSTGPPKVSPRVADDDDAFDSSDEVERRQVWKQFDRYTDNFFRVRVVLIGQL